EVGTERPAVVVRDRDERTVAGNVLRAVDLGAEVVDPQGVEERQGDRADELRIPGGGVRGVNVAHDEVGQLQGDSGRLSGSEESPRIGPLDARVKWGARRAGRCVPRPPA